MNRLFIFFQHVLPLRLISSITGWLTRLPMGSVSHWQIRAFIRLFKVDMRDADQPDASAYPTFNKFFTRALAPGARPLAPAGNLLSPADGTLSQLGQIDDNTLVQAKGHTYSLLDLMDGDADLASPFRHGQHMTIYLAPYNYHRVHAPADGVARKLRYVPGAFYSVNQTTANGIPGLFSRNERVIVTFDSPQGVYALIMVGALNVGSIELNCAADVSGRENTHATQPHGINRPGGNLVSHTTIDMSDGAWQLERGAEFGRFNMGSTVILLTSPNATTWLKDLAPGQALRVGQALGTWATSTSH